MRASSWRAILLACCAAGVLLTVINVLDQLGMGGSPGWYGVTGAYISGCERPFNVAFRGIDPGGPADRAGIREGDCVDFRAEPLLVRFFLLGQPLAGLPITYVVTTAHTGTPHAFAARRQRSCFTRKSSCSRSEIRLVFRDGQAYGTLRYHSRCCPHLLSA